jgi:hypothetical protein
MNGRFRTIGRHLSPLVVLLAALFAAEPILHTHPLTPRADANNPGAPGSACAVCATGVDRLAAVAPSLAAPTVSAIEIAVVAIPTVSIAAPLTLPSRAPPAGV